MPRAKGSFKVGDLVRTLVIEGGTGTFRVKVPEDAKITFGPFSPPNPNARRGYGDGGYSPIGTLRIYVGSEKNIIGCFTHVYSFYEEGMEIEKLVVEESGESFWQTDETGSVQASSTRRKKNWKKAD